MKALVTGGTRGIGRAIAQLLMENGHDVTVCSRNKPSGSGLDRMGWFHFDAELQNVIIGLDFDILVNNVGGAGRTVDMEFAYRMNVETMVGFTQACLPHMRKSGWGRVVTITSLGNDNAWFNMAKKAQEAYMMTMSRVRNYVRNGITFNCVAPGRIAVGKEQDVTLAYLEALPLGRLGTPSEVAAVVAFLCSVEASLVNGAVIPVGAV